MNRQFMIGSIIGAVAVTAVGAIAGYRILDLGDSAAVLAVEPAMKTVSTPREVCHDKLVTQQKPVKDPHQVTGTIAGAVIGGALGSQVGGGSGKDIATVGGAVAGGYAGNKVQEKIQEGNTEQHSQRICETVYDTTKVQDGYEVTYKFDGEERVVHMDQHPGARISLENGEPILN